MTLDPAGALAQEAFLYTYPLYEMSRLRATTSPRRNAVQGLASDDPAVRWCNAFMHGRELRRAGTSRVVTPNNDTLYSIAWLDLAHGPLVIDLPDTAGRYYVLGFLDFYTNPYASIGQRATGTGAGSFVVIPPGWRGELAPRLAEVATRIEAPTRWLWIIGRFLVDGPDDLPAVHALQDALHLRSLAAWEAGAPDDALRFRPDRDAARDLTPEHYAGVVNQALAENGIPAHEQQRVAAYADVGIGPGLPVPAGAACDALQAGIAAGLATLAETPVGSTDAAGWEALPLIEHGYGDAYALRALMARNYIGALDSREAAYPLCRVDGEGRPLSGAHIYRLRFPPGGLPPVLAFWSLTMYDSRDCMLVDNPIDRYAIGDRTRGLVSDADGGLTLHLQHAEPEDPGTRANWLPAPLGPFYLCLRAYLPGEEMLDGRYRLPPVERC